MSGQQAIPPRFAAAHRAIARLARHERYQGAFIFGSVARGETTAASDLDVKVVVAEDNPCEALNHPVIGGVKLDFSFLSLAQLRAATEQEIARGKRIPMLAESIVVFDKTGALSRLRDEVRQARPKVVTAADRRTLRFSLYHEHNKAERFLDTDPPAALLVLHMGLGSLLEVHYQLRGRWGVSSKRLLADLRGWDPALAALVEPFVATASLGPKFRLWTDIVEHIARPLGGSRSLAAMNCDCAGCQENLAVLSAG